MRLGVLDVGSNTVHLLVVDAHRGAQPSPQHSNKRELRLAEHIDRDGDLSKEGADALVRAAIAAREEADELDCDELLAFATSAVRDAGNSTKVLKRVAKEADVSLNVLTGEDEARLTFLAVRRWFGWSAGNLVCQSDQWSGGETRRISTSTYGIGRSTTLRPFSRIWWATCSGVEVL